MEFREKLVGIVGEENCLVDEPLKNHTTFRIGGPADYLVYPENAFRLALVLEACKDAQIPWYILGNGSNLLVGDLGYRGVIIQMQKHMDYLSFKPEDDGIRVKAQAGIMLSKLARRVADEGLAGFEFATGIPGTLGGAVAMNAGAYGGEIKDYITGALVLDQSGDMHTLTREELELGYRESRIQKDGSLVLEAYFKFYPGDVTEINDKIKNLAAARREKQPLEYPSAGSTFKRPKGYFAGKLIQDAGLKGYRVGDAMVSEKHSGFVVNAGQATAADVLQLIYDVQERVKATFGVLLEPEVRMIGTFK